jgi:hypothetical protein
MMNTMNDCYICLILCNNAELMTVCQASVDNCQVPVLAMWCELQGISVYLHLFGIDVFHIHFPVDLRWTAQNTSQRPPTF